MHICGKHTTQQHIHEEMRPVPPSHAILTCHPTPHSTHASMMHLMIAWKNPFAENARSALHLSNSETEPHVQCVCVRSRRNLGRIEDETHAGGAPQQNRPRPRKGNWKTRHACRNTTQPKALRRDVVALTHIISNQKRSVLSAPSDY